MSWINWIDILWLPLGVLLVHKPQRMYAAGFFLACFFMMRMQVELIESTGYPNGFLDILKMDVLRRAQITYSIFYVIYIALALYSRETKGAIFMAASISIFFAALFTSMIILVL